MVLKPRPQVLKSSLPEEVEKEATL